MNQLLKTYPVVVEIPIAWGEMDSYQHVNNAVYFRYFETARIVYLEKLGLSRYKETTGIGPILGFANCKYKIPLAYPDMISVGAKTVSVEEDRFSMQYAIVSHNHQRIAAEGEGVIVIYNYREGKKTAMPDEIREKIQALEKG